MVEVRWRMWDVGCGMWDVGGGMYEVGFVICDSTMNQD